MKKIISAAVVMVFLFVTVTVAMAYVSPIAPVFETTLAPVTTTDVDGDDIDKTTSGSGTTSGGDSGSQGGDSGSQGGDSGNQGGNAATDINGNNINDVITMPVHSDKSPSSPDTGSGNAVGKTAAAAIIAVASLAAAGAYVSKKKIAD